MVIKEIIPVPTAAGEQQRRSYVYVPDYADGSVRFPVLYMFDGHNVFYDEDATYGKSWGMKEYLDKTGIPLIVAAVECNDGRNNERLSEYSPFDFDNHRFGHVQGRGRETMEWFVNVYKPMVDRRFPTVPDRRHTMISGSSMGGLMSIYALIEYNHIFSRAAALSSSIYFVPEDVKRMVREARVDRDTVLYMDNGEQEFGFLMGNDEARGLFAEVISLLIMKKVKLTSRIVPGGGHNEASWEKQIPIFMETLMYGLDW